MVPGLLSATGPASALLDWLRLLVPYRKFLLPDPLPSNGTLTEHCSRQGLPPELPALDAARHVREREGFVLVQVYPINQWGSAIREQKFELIL